MSKWSFSQSSPTVPFLVYGKRPSAPGSKPSSRASEKPQFLGAWHGRDAQDAMCRCQIHYLDVHQPSDGQPMEISHCYATTDRQKLIVFDRISCVGC